MATEPPPAAPLPRRTISLLYECLLLAAVLWCAALALELVEQAFGASHTRLAFQTYLLAVSAVYFVWQWARGGQTLAMKTWRLRVVSTSGGPVAVGQAFMRFAVATAGLALAGFGFVWAFFDRDHQCLHDRIAGTRVVRV